MYVPVLFLRELGIIGVLIFAVPNILGATAMGWLVRDAAQSRRLIGKHQTAFAWYSLVTIAFHAFFAAWMIRLIVGPIAGVAVGGGFVFFWLILQWDRGGQFLAVGIALAISIAVMAWGFLRGDLPYFGWSVSTATLPLINNAWLAPTLFVGFFCCPWLDLTFHAARQALPRPQARAAFLLGFCGLFTLVLLFTLTYSGWLIGGRTENIAFDRARHPQLVFILATYFIVQSCLTAALHARQLSRIGWKISIRHFLLFSALLVIAVLLGVLGQRHYMYHGMRLGEVFYRAFLGFYGLVFPAYIWLIMIPPRRSVLRLATIILIAAPLYWLTFVEDQMIFGIPAVAILILSKFLPGQAGKTRVVK
jgi:hypothetical protein